jgi:hypothetical protein
MEHKTSEKKETANSDLGVVRRSYSQMVDDFLKEMLQKSPFNSVEWVRFKEQQLNDFIYYSPEYTAISGGNDYIFRSEKYNIKSSMKRWLRKKNIKFNGDEYKIAKCFL